VYGTVSARGSGKTSFPAFAAEVVLTSLGEGYIRPQVVDFSSLGDLEQLIGMWWSWPRGNEALAVAEVSPDPRMLRAQAEAVAVERDRGMDTVNGHRTYHFDVALDGPKLLRLLQTQATEQGGQLTQGGIGEALRGYDARGELWVDAETFFIHRLAWTVRLPGEQMLRFQADLRDHNAAPLITPPADPRPLSAELSSRLIRSLLPLLPFSSLPEEGPSASGAIFFLE